MKRLPIPANIQSVNACPPPILFSVPSVDIKRKIINRSRELRADIQFCGDASKAERDKRKTLIDTLKTRINSGEKDLIIFKGQIVTKTLQIITVGKFQSQP